MMVLYYPDMEIENQALKDRRYQTAMRIKIQAQVCNYGLPKNVDTALPHLANLSLSDACKKLRAIAELCVRLDLWVATGEYSEGVIQFPEAKRHIRYRLMRKNPESSEVLFKSLVPDRKRTKGRR